MLGKLVAFKRIVSEPGSLKVALRGHSVPLYLRLRQPWLQSVGIRAVVDVGANIGQFAEVARAAFPLAELHCFEPLSDCFAELKKRLKGASGVSLYNVALGERAGTGTMVRNPFSPSSSLLDMAHSHVQAFPFTAGGDRVAIGVTTLDAMFDEHPLCEPLLVKIDVQGVEDRVIAGGQ